MQWTVAVCWLRREAYADRVSAKKEMLAGRGKEKDASRLRALELFPHLQEELKLKKHHNRADALLIAEWGRRKG